MPVRALRLARALARADILVGPGSMLWRDCLPGAFRSDFCTQIASAERTPVRCSWQGM